MAWIESHQELASHPKTRRLASSLGVSVPTAIGHLHLLWWWALDYALEGELAGLEPDEIAYGAQWDGDAEQFMAALTRCGFIDEDLTIHDWWQYAGRYVTDRQKNAERMRKARAEQKAKTAREKAQRAADAAREPDDGSTYKERAPHVQSTSPARAPATVPNQTVPNKTDDDVSRAPTHVRESDIDVTGDRHPYLDGMFDGDDPADTTAVEIAQTLGIRGYVNAERGLADTLREFSDEPDVVAQARQWAAKFGDDSTRSAGQRQQSFKLWLERERQARLHPQARGSPNGHVRPEPTLRNVTPEEIAAAEIRFGHTDS